MTSQYIYSKITFLFLYVNSDAGIKAVISRVFILLATALLSCSLPLHKLQHAFVYVTKLENGSVELMQVKKKTW